MTNRLILSLSTVLAFAGVVFVCGALYVAGTNDGYTEGFRDARRVTFNCEGETVQIDNYQSDVYTRFAGCTLVPSK